jgi:pimeloyl-ACP methyl ester carboxylesterase
MKQDLILVHGALSSAQQMSVIAKSLEEHYSCSLPTLLGHGGKAIPPDGYSFGLFAQDLLQHMDEKGIQKADFFGYSMGGYAAMVLALAHPERVGRIATLGTKFDWNPTTALRETQMLNPDIMEQKIPAFTSYLSKVHAPVPWRDVVSETASFMKRLGNNPDLHASALRNLKQVCLLLVGDQDSTAGVDATRTAAMCLPNGAFKVLPDTPHVLEKANVDVITSNLKDFFGRS